MRCKYPLSIIGIRKPHLCYYAVIYGILYFSYIVFLGLSSSSFLHESQHQRRPRSFEEEPEVFSMEVPGINYVVFNRVPKCGSMSMTQLAYDLGGNNNFKVESPYEPGEKQQKTNDEQVAFREHVLSQSPPYMYIRHQYFVDFPSETERKEIAYINMIRDPIARFESFYYFSRFGNNLGGGGKAKLSADRKGETVDECVAKRRQECLKPWWQIVPYLCGQDPKCQERDTWAVERAKYNIDHNYAFVGVLEELPKSLEVLDALLPRFYKDAPKLVKGDSFQKMRKGTLTTVKQKANSTTRQFLMLETSLKYEYELYFYVLQKLNEKWESILR